MELTALLITIFSGIIYLIIREFQKMLLGVTHRNTRTEEFEKLVIWKACAAGSTMLFFIIWFILFNLSNAPVSH